MRNFFYRFGIFRFIYRTVFAVRQRTRKSLLLIEEQGQTLGGLRDESLRRQDELAHAVGGLREEVLHTLRELRDRVEQLDHGQKERGDFLFQAQEALRSDLGKALKTPGGEDIGRLVGRELKALRESQVSASALQGLQDQLTALKTLEAERGDFMHQRHEAFEQDLRAQLQKARRETREIQEEGLKRIRQEVASARAGEKETLNKAIAELGKGTGAPAQVAERARLEDYGRLFGGKAAKLRRIPKLKDALNDYSLLLEEGEPFRLWGYEIGYLDRKSLWIQLNELVFREEYHFSEDFDAPHRIIDGGSNIGLSLLFFKAVYPNAEIIGFEPNEECYRVAMENITRNKLTGVTLIKAALSTETGRQTLFLDSRDSMAASLAPREITEDLRDSAVEVETVALADCLDKPVDFLKLDIEGSEAEVMKSVRDKLDGVGSIFCEYHFGKGNGGNSLRDIIDVLDDAGFDYQVAKSVWFGDHSEYRPLQHVGENYSGVVYARKRGD